MMRWPAILAACGLGIACCLQSPGHAAETASSGTRPVKVELIQTNGGYQLLVNRQPFYIKGAGIEFGLASAARGQPLLAGGLEATMQGGEEGQRRRCQQVVLVRPLAARRDRAGRGLRARFHCIQHCLHVQLHGHSGSHTIRCGTVFDKQ